MTRKLKIWYDREGDYLEVLFSDLPGFMRETDNDNMMERIDENGNIIGYSILGISNIKDNKPIYAELNLM